MPIPTTQQSAASLGKPLFRYLALAGVLAVAAVLLLRDLGNSALGYADADRLLMDGVFILDFLRDLPLTRIYDYTVQYYAQYPALSIGYRPPFFPFVEALFNGMFGINMWSSRLAILAFAVVGIGAWFKLTERIFDLRTAFWSTLLLVTTPFVVKWGWYTMGELPVLSMAMLTGYLFYRYHETRQPRFLYATALAFALTVWTKQTAVFLVLWFVLFIVLNGDIMRYLRRKETYIASAIVVVLVAPLAAVTLWLGDLNVAQSVGAGDGAKVASRLNWGNLKIHLLKLYQYHLTLPVLALSVLGLVWAGIVRERRLLYFALLILATYLFFTYLTGKNERYPIFWIPAFCVAAAVPVFLLRGRRVLHNSLQLLLAAVVAIQVVTIFGQTPNYAGGYDEAAREVLSASRSPTVLFDGYNNGYFTYFMRALDPGRSMFVLRGDKLLSSSAIKTTTWLEVHASTEQDIADILDSNGIDYIVVESEDRTGVAIHERLRKFLREGPFKLVREIPIETSRDPLMGQSLLIYRYEDAKPLTAEYLELRLPVVGQTLKVPLRKLVSEVTGQP